MAISTALGIVPLSTVFSSASAAFARYGSDLEITSSGPPCNDSISSLGFRPSLSYPALLNAYVKNYRPIRSNTVFDMDDNLSICAGNWQAELDSSCSSHCFAVESSLPF